MKNNNYLGAFIFCIVVAFLISRECVSDDYCDPDPIYGGCSSVCSYEDVTLFGVASKAIGLYIFGVIFSFIATKEYEKNN